MSNALPPVDLSALEVLIVDDSVHMRRIFRSILNGFDIRKVHEAEDGAAALEWLESNPADFLFIDWEMPVIDGAELVKLIRNPEHAAAYMPIFMITGHSTRSRVRQATKLGVNEVLCKPIVPRHLYQRVVSTLLNPRPFIRTGNYFGPEPRKPKIDPSARPAEAQPEANAQDVALI